MLQHLRHNLVAYVALFFALGGSAIAAKPLIIGADVKDDTLTGADIVESTLDQVPAALTATLAGTGRSAHAIDCDPDSTAFVTCVDVKLNLPSTARVLLIGAVDGDTEAFFTTRGALAFGTCRLGTSATGGLPGSEITVKTSTESVSGLAGEEALTAVTPPVGPGEVSFGIDCNGSNQEGTVGIRYETAKISAVALSPN